MLFDEYRYMYLKRLRAQGHNNNIMQQLLTGEEDTILRNADNNSYPVSHFETNMALNVNQFDLILHTFTQSQHMSTFITSLQKEEMAYY